MKYEYKVLNLNTELSNMRKISARKLDGNEVLLIEFINAEGLKGWRWMNPGNPHEAYFERVSND